MFKQLQGYRTYIVNGVFALAGILLGTGIAAPDEAAKIASAWGGGAMVIVSVVNQFLRSITSTPPGKKPEPKAEQSSSDGGAG